MDRRTVRALAIIVISLIASGFIAASFSAPVPNTPSSGGGSSAWTGGGIAGPPPGSGEPLTVVSVPWIDELFFALLGITILLVVLYAGVYRPEYRPLLVASTVLIVSVVIFIELFTTSDSDASLLYAILVELVGTGDTDPTTGILSNHTISLLGALILLCLGAAGLAAHTRPPQESNDSTAGTESEEQSTHAIGRAAGRAADRLEAEQSFENEIYRAWTDMTNLLSISRPTDAMTPEEFATEAISIGMQPTDVNDLTRLFEDVRYGGYPVTDDREEKALQLFRRIEDTYAPTDQ